MITPEELAQAKKELNLIREYSIDTAVKELADELGVKMDEVMERSRNREVSRLRWCFYSFLYRRGYRISEISKYFKLTHATVIHGLKQLKINTDE